jgi:hypothetical protein
MTSGSRIVKGAVLKLRCDACASEFPHFSFEGEGDTDTIGLGSLTSCSKNELVLAEIEPAEWNTFDRGGSARFQERFQREMSRDDLRLVTLMRSVSRSPSGARVGFQEYVKSYKPPELILSCPCCEAGESRVAEEVTIEQFIQSGGRVTPTGRLTI